jgi:RiboL-PSP-HEPN
MIEDAIQQFRLNIKSAKELGNIVDAILLLAPHIDTSEVLRAQLVLAVSAFDCFIHDLVRLGTVEIYQGSRSYDQKKTLKPEFEIPKLIHLLTLSKQDQLKDLNKEFQRIFKTKTFQEPNIIEKNLICIGLENIWFEVGLRMTLTKEDLIRQINLIMARRNSIVHEADIDLRGALGQKTPIDKEEVLKNVLFMEVLCEKIYELADE